MMEMNQMLKLVVERDGRPDIVDNPRWQQAKG